MLGEALYPWIFILGIVVVSLLDVLGNAVSTNSDRVLSLVQVSRKGCCMRKSFWRNLRTNLVFSFSG